MSLSNNCMQLSAAEKRWLPWFGKTGKLAMGWACWLNRSRYPIMEQTFESIASTRIKLLQQWVKRQWAQLESCSGQLQLLDDSYDNILRKSLSSMGDCIELFVIDRQGKTLASSYAARIGAQDLVPNAVSAGLSQAFLHGPYKDPQTLTIGKRSSSFHDQVTLMSSGASGVAPAIDEFEGLLTALCEDLAMQLMADAEGANAPSSAAPPRWRWRRSTCCCATATGTTTCAWTPPRPQAGASALC